MYNFIFAFHCFALPGASKELTYAKTLFPLTRGLLKHACVKPEPKAELVEHDDALESKIKKALRKKINRNKRKLKKRLRHGLKAKKGRPPGRKNDNKGKREKKEKPHICSICNQKTYKYKRNKMRHEKYECVTGPQFECDTCGKRYSQKKSLTAHVDIKHANPPAPTTE